MTRTSPQRRATGRRLAPALVLAGLLAGCGDDQPDPSGTSSDEVTFAPATPSETTTPQQPAAPPTATGSDAPTGDLPAFGAADRVAEQAPSGDRLTVTDVRVARQDGYDRVVLELAGGDGQPGWSVQYDDDPRQQGSGDPVEVAGDATLSVLVTGAGYPFDTGVEEYGGPRSLTPAGTEVVREVRLGGVFEGQYDAWVGTASPRPFRVFRLDSPARVVIDVQH